MNRDTRNGKNLTTGMDLSDRTTQICVLDAGDEVVEETRLTLTERAIRRRFRQLPPSRVALEVGTHSPWVSRVVADCGHEVIVANPRRVQLIARSDRKSDRRDAESLARLARLDPKLLAPIRHRGCQWTPTFTQLGDTQFCAVRGFKGWLEGAPGSRGMPLIPGDPETVRAFASSGTVRELANGATQLEIRGSYLSSNGTWYDGAFTFIKDASGVITHRMFHPF